MVDNVVLSNVKYAGWHVGMRLLIGLFDQD